MATPPNASIFATTPVAALSWCKKLTQTRNPRAAAYIAVAAPMPREAPVIRTTLSMTGVDLLVRLTTHQKKEPGKPGSMMSKASALLEVFLDQLGHLEHRDLRLAKHFLQLRVSIDEAPVDAVLQ